MQMCLINVIHILCSAVACMPHITDDIPRKNDRTFFQLRLVGKSLPQMRIIIVSLFVKAADTDPPAPVLVPAQRLDISGFHTDYGRPDLPKHVMPQMVSFISVTSGHPKIIIIRVRESFGNRAESLQAVSLFPALSAVLIRCFNLVLSHHAAQNRGVCLLIV